MNKSESEIARQILKIINDDGIPEFVALAMIKKLAERLEKPGETMTIYATLIVILKDGSHAVLNFKQGDTVSAEDGGFEVNFASSPATTTFYPYHRIWEYQEIDTALLPSAVNDEDSFPL